MVERGRRSSWASDSRPKTSATPPTAACLRSNWRRCGSNPPNCAQMDKRGHCQAAWSRSGSVLAGMLIPTMGLGAGVRGRRRNRSGWAS